MRIIKNKTIRELIYRIAANYMIAKDSLDKAHDANKISVKQYAYAIQCLTDNTVNIASAIGGLKGLNLINEIIQKKVFNR